MLQLWIQRKVVQIMISHHTKNYPYTNQLLNAVIHGIGIVLSVIGTWFLIQKGLAQNSAIQVFAYTIYGLSMCSLYTASTVYHSLYFTKVAPILKIFDHSSIFLLIAGTYTPFCLIAIQGKLGWFIFIVEWLITIIGIFMKIFFLQQTKKYSTFLYILMGWFILFVIGDVILAIGKGGLLFLVLGGVTYTIGTYFYANSQRHYWHVIWHLFVLAASLFMYVSIYYFI